MKQALSILFMSLTFASVFSCDTLNAVLGEGGGGITPLTNDQIILGLKEALNKGVKSGVNVLSVKDGFFKNAAVKILFPPEAQKVEKTLRDVGAGKLVDVAVEKINNAAEDASGKAVDIFVGAITKMTVNDAMGILMGDKNSCTEYLKKTSSKTLYDSFNPVIGKSLNAVGASDAWTAVISKYNKIPFIKKVNPDLDDYVTNKAMDGVFLMVEKEERAIRKDPIKRTTDLLKRVFAKQDGN
ncbi:MAG: DUF4197 domain-containing protein [Aureispira sp.]|nr:DUF4197 domain-containing protein [Aureispira sp.]